MDLKKYGPPEIELIVRGISEKGRKGPGLSEDQLAQLMTGIHDEKTQYWAERYCKRGLVLKNKEEKETQQFLNSPIARREVIQMILATVEKELLPLTFACMEAINTLTEVLMRGDVVNGADLEKVREDLAASKEKLGDTVGELRNLGVDVEPEEPSRIVTL